MEVRTREPHHRLSAKVPHPDRQSPHSHPQFPSFTHTMGKRTNLKKKAVDLLSPNKPLPSPEEAAAQAEAERLQEEEELAEYRRQEAEELERLKKPSPGPQLDVVDEGRKKSSKDRFKEREVRPSLFTLAHAASRPVPLLRGADRPRFVSPRFLRLVNSKPCWLLCRRRMRLMLPWSFGPRTQSRSRSTRPASNSDSSRTR